MRILPFALLATVALVAPSCSKDPTLPGQITGDGRPPPSGGGGDGGATTDGGGVHDGSTTSCIDTPTLLAGFAPSRILYVAADGNDSNDGLSRSTAWRSLAKLGAELLPGDRVDVFAGTFDCSASIGVAGTATKPVWIRSADGPKKAVFACGGAPYGFHLVSASYVVIDGFEIDAANLDGVHIDSGAGPTFTKLSDHIVVVNNHIHGTGAAGVRATQATNVDVFSNEIDTTEAFGPNLDAQAIDLVAVDGARVVGNTIHDVRNNVAIQVRGGAKNALVAANVLTNNLEAIRLGGNTDRGAFLPPDSAVEAKNALAHSNVITGGTGIAFAAIGCDSCVFANNTVAITAATQPVRALSGAAGTSSTASVSHTIGLHLVNNIFSFSSVTPVNLLAIASTEEAGFVQSNNLFFLATGSVSSITSDVAIGGTGTIVDKDPLFARPASGDYSLAAGSPAAGAGTALPAVRYTATGACRTVFDIGAY